MRLDVTYGVWCGMVWCGGVGQHAFKVQQRGSPLWADAAVLALQGAARTSSATSPSATRTTGQRPRSCGEGSATGRQR
jgi:hypothetical protein